MNRNYWACALERGNCPHQAAAPPLLKPGPCSPCPAARQPCNRRPPTAPGEQPLLATTEEGPNPPRQRPVQPNANPVITTASKSVCLNWITPINHPLAHEANESPFYIINFQHFKYSSFCSVLVKLCSFLSYIHKMFYAMYDRINSFI